MEHPPKRTKLTHEASIYGDRVDLTSDGSDKEEQGSKISLGKLPVAQVACNNERKSHKKLTVHFNHDVDSMLGDCPKKTTEKRPPTTEPTYLCDICGKNISHYNTTRRMQHMNRCCDNVQKDTHNTKISPIASEAYFCRICGKDMTKSLLKTRISHLKHCAKKHKVSPSQFNPHTKGTTHSPKNPELREPNGIVRSRFFTLTEKLKGGESSLGADNGIPLATSMSEAEAKPSSVVMKSSILDPTAPTKKVTPRKKATKGVEPVCKEQENIMLAVALSLSDQQSQAPAEVFDKLASQSATPRDLAGFRISDFPLDAGIQKIKAKALGSMFPENATEEILPTPTFSESSLAARKQSIGVSLWGLSVSSVTKQVNSEDTNSKHQLVTEQQNELGVKPSITSAISGADLSELVELSSSPCVKECTSPPEAAVDFEINADNNVTSTEASGTRFTTSDNSEFTKKASTVLEWYSTTCRQKKLALEEKIKALEQEFYSELGRITLEKEQKIAKLSISQPTPCTSKIIMPSSQFELQELQPEGSSVSQQHRSSSNYDFDLETEYCRSFNLAQTPPPSFSSPTTVHNQHPSTNDQHSPSPDSVSANLSPFKSGNYHPYLPDYEAMSIPELKKLMAQYGMKAGSKPFMVEHLHRVWRATNVTNQSQDSGMEHRDERAPLCNTDIVEDCIVKCLREQNIYENILQYKEINLSAAMESLKGSVKCNKKSLQDVLEKQGVAYTNH